MLPEEMRAAVRQQVMLFCKVDPMLHVQGRTLERLLDQSLVRIIARDLLPFSGDYEEDGLGDVFALHVELTGERNRVSGMTPWEAAEHIVEWLTWSIRADSHWIGRINADGDILKLKKLGSIPVMINEADKSIAKLQEGHFEPESEEDVEPVMALEGGYRMVRLLSPKSLRNETAMTQHCIGLGGYDERVVSPNHAFYSLRDPRGRSHVTMHAMRSGARWQVVEMRGKQNRMAVIKYRRLILPFLDRERFDWAGAEAHAGILVGEDDRHYPYDEFPEGMKVRDLDVSHYGTPVDLQRMPKFSRHLRVGRSEIAAWPSPPIFPGNVDLRDNGLFSLPQGMRVAGDLDLSRTRFLRSLPEDLEVGGRLILDTSKVHVFARSVRFGTLQARGIPIVLPKGYVAQGGLDLSEDYGQIELCDDLHVKGDLNLSNLAIFSLPEGLVVDGVLDISGTRIRRLPRRVRVGGLRARSSDLEHLGGLRRVAGTVDLSWSPVHTLPSRMRIGGDLDLRGCLVDMVPSGVHVEGALRVGRGYERDGDLWKRVPFGVHAGTIRLGIGFRAGSVEVDGRSVERSLALGQRIKDRFSGLSRTVHASSGA